tara:strand:- start:1632 stop:2093 length:462 start_codon:yes stop_codon:yes gene_type:complete
MKILDESKAIRIKIMDFLSRREHSAKEIYQKMSSRVESKDMLSEEINKLISDGLISDERFAESYFQSRKNRGFGPLRIKNELNQKGVKEDIFYSIQSDTDWSACAFFVLEKKINGNKPDDMKAILKLKNFLNYRGFEFQDINKAFSKLEEENR